jgi:hypothetical protein
MLGLCGIFDRKNLTRLTSAIQPEGYREISGLIFLCVRCYV